MHCFNGYFHSQSPSIVLIMSVVVGQARALHKLTLLLEVGSWSWIVDGYFGLCIVF